MKVLTKISFLILLIIFYSCDNKVHKNEFIGTYTLNKTIPLDSNSVSSVEKTYDWKIILSDSNNFQFNGMNKKIIGYWALENTREEYRLLFHSGDIRTYARFNGKEIYFDKPNRMFDSVFSEALFTKTIK